MRADRLEAERGLVILRAGLGVGDLGARRQFAGQRVDAAQGGDGELATAARELLFAHMCSLLTSWPSVNFLMEGEADCLVRRAVILDNAYCP